MGPLAAGPAASSAVVLPGPAGAPTGSESPVPPAAVPTCELRGNAVRVRVNQGQTLATGSGLEITYEGSSHDNQAGGGFDFLHSLRFRRGAQEDAHLASLRDRAAHEVLGHCYRIVDAAPAVVLLDVAPLRPGTAAAALPPPLQLPQLLGLPRPEVEAQLPAVTSQDSGWVLHGADLAVRYDPHDRVERIAAGVPGGLSCSEAAEWVGYAAPPPPLRRQRSCAWPGVSERHRLRLGHAGRLDLDSATFELWLIQ